MIHINYQVVHLFLDTYGVAKIYRNLTYTILYAGSYQDCTKKIESKYK